MNQLYEASNQFYTTVAAVQKSESESTREGFTKILGCRRFESETQKLHPNASRSRHKPPKNTTAIGQHNICVQDKYES